MLDALSSAAARATFFIQGRWAAANPGLARRIAGDGHLIGNHSNSHAPMDILAVDGGNSKLDAVLIGAAGTVLGTARGHGASFSPGDHEDSFDELRRTVHRAARAAGIDPERGAIARVGVHCLAGADLPVDDRRLQKRLKELAWTPRIVLRNDTFAVLRA